MARNRHPSPGADPFTTKLVLDHIEEHHLSGGDLIFPLHLFEVELVTAPDPLTPIPNDLGRTDPDEHGRSYKHGTTTGYGPGRCRCKWCRRAIAEYRADRRALGLDRKPRKETKRGTCRLGAPSEEPK